MSHGSFFNLASLLDLLPKNIQNLRILDVGFGNGQVLHTIMSQGTRRKLSCASGNGYSGTPYIIGLDIDPINVEFAKTWMPFYREVYEYDATMIPYPEAIIKDIDILICTEVVEHLKDKDKALKMIEYLSDKAKLIIFMCPYGNTLSNKNKEIDYDNHNSIWYDSDFRKLSFNTKIIKKIYWSGIEYMIVSFLLDLINTIKPHNKSITKNILAWKDNTK